MCVREKERVRDGEGKGIAEEGPDLVLGRLGEGFLQNYTFFFFFLI